MIEPQPEDALLADMKYKLTTRAWNILNNVMGSDPALKTIKGILKNSTTSTFCGGQIAVE